MKELNKRSKVKNKKIITAGFTLVELLVAVAILGILGIGLLTALNPLEQLRRAQDTSTRNIVEEFYNAVLRYYSFNNQLPWGKGTVAALPLDETIDATGYMQSLIDAGELKPKFAEDLRLGKVFLTSTSIDASGYADELSVCFAPQSKAIQGEENTKYDIQGEVDNSCTSTICYWCLK